MNLENQAQHKNTMLPKINSKTIEHNHSEITKALYNIAHDTGSNIDENGGTGDAKIPKKRGLRDENKHFSSVNDGPVS